MSMNLSSFKKLTIGGIELKQLFIGGVQAWKSGYKNWVPVSIGTDKKVYNGGLGYKNGYRLSSSGGESEAALCTVTGFIKAAAGDTIRIKGYQWYDTKPTTNYLIAYNSSFAKAYTGNAKNTYDSTILIKSMNYDSASGISTVVLNSGLSFAYIRISVQNNPSPDGSNLIVTVNEEIT
jgi:hypothetical protein